MLQHHEVLKKEKSDWLKQAKSMGIPKETVDRVSKKFDAKIADAVSKGKKFDSIKLPKVKGKGE